MRAAIVKDGVITTFVAPWWRVLLCKLGLHGWSYWHMAPEFIAAFPATKMVCRDCEHCGCMEATDDGRTWRARA